MAEQLHPRSGEPLSVSPLTWSQAAYVMAVDEYLDRVRRLTSCPACGQPMSGAAHPLGHAAGVPAGVVILFQGDSITDCGRDRAVVGPNRADGFGTGYPLLIAARLLSEHPDAGLSIFNRGVSGNMVPDLAARWETDCLALRPDVLSVLIGVNDFWRTVDSGYHGTVADYEREYDALLVRTREALPRVRLIVLEPFALRSTGGAVTDAWFPDFDLRRAAAARVAHQAGATFVPLQGMFDQLVRRAPAAYWSADGVHPTIAGHGAIAREWLKRVGW
jgi:lysophospholipase L1-like esterase